MQQMLSKLALAVSWDRTQYNAEEKSENRRAISGNGVKRWRFVHVVVQLGYGRREMNLATISVASAQPQLQMQPTLPQSPTQAQ